MYSKNDYRYYELYHHGILGQKWHIRRFQNSDGSLTAAGRERYGVKSNGKKVGELGDKSNRAKSERKKRFYKELTDKLLKKYSNDPRIKKEILKNLNSKSEEERRRSSTRLQQEMIRQQNQIHQEMNRQIQRDIQNQINQQIQTDIQNQIQQQINNQINQQMMMW